MKHTLKSIFSIYLLFSLFLVSAQETKSTQKPKDSIVTEKAIILPENTKQNSAKVSEEKTAAATPVKTDRYGLRVGVDLFRLTRAFYDKGYKGIELAGDYRLTKKYYLAAEVGNENKTTDDVRLNFTTKGSYLKAGFDYNTYENWLDMENIISIGMRLGFSSFNQELNTYKIYNSNHYFGETPALVSGEKFSNLSASWIEVVAGVKAKLFNNVFAGFSLRLNRFVSNKKPANFDNLYIPGFNRTYNGDFGVGFNYTITYFLPIYKKQVVAKKEQATEKSKMN